MRLKIKSRIYLNITIRILNGDNKMLLHKGWFFLCIGIIGVLSRKSFGLGNHSVVIIGSCTGYESSFICPSILTTNYQLLHFHHPA